MGNPTCCFDRWNEPPDKVRENRHDRQVEEEDGLPAPVLNNERSIKWPEYTSRFSHHADQAEGQRPLLFTVKVAHNSHCDRYDSASPCCLHKSCRYEPDQAGVKSCRITEVARRGHVYAAVLQEPDIDLVPQDRCEATEE